MAKDFPVDFRTDDLIGSWETLQNYRMQESLIDDETSDFVYNYIKDGIEWYETRIEQIKAQLEWFSFIDAETTKERFSDYYGCGTKYNEAAKLHGSMFIAQKRSEQFLKQGAIYVASLHAKRAADAEYLLFMECD